MPSTSSVPKCPHVQVQGQSWNAITWAIAAASQGLPGEGGGAGRRSWEANPGTPVGAASALIDILKSFFHDMKGRMRQTRRAHSCIHWFAPHMVGMMHAGPGGRSSTPACCVSGRNSRPELSPAASQVCSRDWMGGRAPRDSLARGHPRERSSTLHHRAS